MLVKYDNKFNLLAFKDISKIEYDLFFAIIARLKEKNTDKLSIDFADLTTFIGKNLTNNEVTELLNTSLNKIVQTFVNWETEETITKFTIFKIFKIHKEKAVLEVSLNEVFVYLLNNFHQGFCVWELAEFSSLTSKYSQTLYRLLKQFKYTGLLKMSWENFLEIMNIPKNYKMCNIEQWILKPAVKELSSINSFRKELIFKKLSYEKEYYAKRGRPVKAITFTFMPETKLQDDPKNPTHTESIAKSTKLKLLQEQSKKDKEIIEQQQIQERQVNQQITQLANKINVKNHWYRSYIGAHFLSKSDFTGLKDTCKIINFEYNGQKFTLTARNQENESIFTKEFDSEQHFKNWFNKSYGGF